MCTRYNSDNFGVNLIRLSTQYTHNHTHTHIRTTIIIIYQETAMTLHLYKHLVMKRFIKMCHTGFSLISLIGKTFLLAHK